MSQDLMIRLVLFGIALLMAAGIAAIAIRRKGWGNFASLTAYHDFQRTDKQDAIEIVMEKKAGKKMEEQESGDGSNQ